MEKLVVELNAVFYSDKGLNIIEVREFEVDKLIVDEREDDLGAWFMQESEYSDIIHSVIDWQVFSKLFQYRIFDILTKAGVDDLQKKNFMNTILKTKKYLLRFNNEDRLDFLLNMYSLFSDAYNKGSDDVIKYINSKLTPMLESSEEYKKKKEDFKKSIEEKRNKTLKYWDGQFKNGKKLNKI